MPNRVHVSSNPVRGGSRNSSTGGSGARRDRGFFDCKPPRRPGQFTGYGLDRFRDHFPVTAHWAFLDHAAVAAPPAACVDAHCGMGRRQGRQRHHVLPSLGQARRGNPPTGRPAAQRRPARRLLRQQHHARHRHRRRGLPLEARRQRRHRRRGVPVESVPVDEPGAIAASKPGPSRAAATAVDIDDIRAAMDARTRVLAISSVEFASGFRNDLAALGELCRQRGVFFFVDAIQSLGVFPLDVQQLPIDALAADSHKWLLGPEGAGIAYIRREWVDRLHATGVGWNSVVHAADFSTIDFHLKPHAGRWEGGTRERRRHRRHGREPAAAARRRHRERPGPRPGVDRLPVRPGRVGRGRGVQQPAPGEESGIVSLLTPGRDPKELMKRCKAAGVVVNVRGGRLRVSPHAITRSKRSTGSFEVRSGSSRLTTADRDRCRGRTYWSSRTR